MHSGVTGGARARPMRARLDLCDLTAAQFVLLFAIFFIVAAVPILVVETVPLFDYPNHLARMHILAQDGRSAIIGRFYTAEWRPIPNLAMDLVVPLLSRVMPLALAGKSFLLAIFLLIAGGTAALHRVLFGRWSAWSLLAFLLLYNRILLWGFVNFLFGVGLLLFALTSWIGLRERAMWQRLAIATGFACALYLAHLFAFAVYALVVPGYELARLHRQRRRDRLEQAGAQARHPFQHRRQLSSVVRHRDLRAARGHFRCRHITPKAGNEPRHDAAAPLAL